MKENFVALEQEKLSLLGDVHQIIVEKQKTQQQHGELALHVQQLKAIIMSFGLAVHASNTMYFGSGHRPQSYFPCRVSTCHSRSYRCSLHHPED